MRNQITAWLILGMMIACLLFAVVSCEERPEPRQGEVETSYRAGNVHQLSRYETNEVVCYSRGWDTLQCRWKDKR